MSNNCPKCGAITVQKRGISSRTTGENLQRYHCSQCQGWFSISISPPKFPIEKTLKVEIPKQVQAFSGKFTRSDEWITEKLNSQKFVVTSAQSNTNVNQAFFNALKTYCHANGAKLIIVPYRYKNPTTPNAEVVDEYPSEIHKYLIENKINLHPKLQVLGQLKIAATSDNPLGGLIPLSKGNSLIIGHNQLQMMTLPVQVNDHPVIMTTTGTISEKNYSISKVGYKAEFNHSMSAVVVELDDDLFHIRHLNFDGTGFYDFDTYYTNKSLSLCADSVTAIVTGDEHAMFASEAVKNATYGVGGIVDSMPPKFIIRHDVLDCYSVSHHHRKNFLIQFKKHITGQNDMCAELNETINYVLETTNHGAMNIFVASNHTDHLTQWLNEADPKREPWNAILYHTLMASMLTEIEGNPSKTPYPFELYSSQIFVDNMCDVTYLGRNDTYMIHDIEIAAHGDRGVNGSRGSRDQFANLSAKSIIGHSHSPGIEKGCYQVGTSSILQMEYNTGPSSWLNTHCLIYKNGKRQLINIIEGKWRA